MKSFRNLSEPHLLPSMVDPSGERDDSNLEGVIATVKLLMKLIEDHKSACSDAKNDGRRMLRVAGMMTVLENVKTRIQKSQSFGNSRTEAELRRCQTEVHRPSHSPRDKRPTEPVDEKQKLRRELSASLTARKSLEAMCSSLGKEKEIMACELSRKVQELSGMEELVSDLKAQNETLSTKVKEFALEIKKPSADVALQERNRALSEQLLKSLDGYKTMKRKLKEANEESKAMRETMEEIGAEVDASLERIRGFRSAGGEPTAEIEDEIGGLERVFECLQIKVSKHAEKKGECLKPKREIRAHSPSLAI